MQLLSRHQAGTDSAVICWCSREYRSEFYFYHDSAILTSYNVINKKKIKRQY